MEVAVKGDSDGKAQFLRQEVLLYNENSLGVHGHMSELATPCWPIPPVQPRRNMGCKRGLALPGTQYLSQHAKCPATKPSLTNWVSMPRVALESKSAQSKQSAQPNAESPHSNKPGCHTKNPHSLASPGRDSPASACSRTAPPASPSACSSAGRPPEGRAYTCRPG